MLGWNKQTNQKLFLIHSYQFMIFDESGSYIRNLIDKNRVN